MVVRAEERVRGEIARAVVSTVPGSGLSVREVQAYCRDRMAVYKVPRLVEFWSEVPKLPNGKINKRAVLDTPLIPQEMNAEHSSPPNKRSPTLLIKDLGGIGVVLPQAGIGRSGASAMVASTQPFGWGLGSSHGFRWRRNER